MKKIAILLLAAATALFAADAKKMSELKIYINPGHGGYTSNDRPIRIHPFEQNDTNGYWESKSNLYKGLHMYHILDSLGATPYLSRTKNTEDDDRSLSGISAEANRLGVDLFFSIHSNAGEDVNTPLMLYRENTIGTPRYPENVTLSKILWKNLYSSKLPVWTRQTEYVVGDLTFYDKMWQGGLGVLRTLYVVGLLSEGSMHEHRPEAHRLMNDDYLWLEAWHFVKSIMEFYDTEDRFVTGNVAGVVYDNHNMRELIQPVGFHAYGRDTFAPLNGASVELLDKSGKVVQTRTTDDMYNGVFVFRNVAPGDYTLRSVRDGYYEESKPVTVTACEVTYQDMPLTLKRDFPLEITAYTPVSGEADAVSCASTVDFTFNTDVDTESFEKAFSITPAVEGYFKYSDSYRKASFIPTLSLDLNTKYTVRIAKTAKHPDGYTANPYLKDDLEFSFVTKGRNRLELIDRYPVDGGEVHYVSPTLEFRFDKTINAASIYDQVTVKDSKGKAVTINKRGTKFNQLSNGYGNAIIALSGNLTVGETYTVTLSGELRDRENLPLGADVVTTFKAADATAATDATVINGFENGAVFAYNPEATKGIGSTLPGALASTAVKLFDKSSARFTYTFTDNHDGEIVWDYNGEPHQFVNGDVIGSYVNGDFNNHELWVAVTSGTDTKWAKLCDLTFLGWQYHEVKLDMLEAGYTYIFSGVKIVQKSSPITQKGAFCLDDLSARYNSDGISDITVGDAGIDIAVTGDRITVTSDNEVALVEIINAAGVVVKAVIGSDSIATDAIAHGVYIVKASTKDGRSATRRVVI